MTGPQRAGLETPLPNGGRWAYLLALGAPWLIAAGLILHWGEVQLAGESPCYLAWCEKNPAVYPALVWAAGRDLLLPLQLGFLAIALTWLGWLLSRHFGYWITAIILLGLVSNPYVWQLQGSVMSEALTTPLLIIVIGTSCLYAFRGRPASILVAFFAAGLSVGARPAALMTVIIPLLVMWLKAPPSTVSRRLQLSALGILMWMAPVIAERLTTHFVLGDRQTSLVGRHAMGKAAVIEAPPIDRSGLNPLEHRVADMMERQYAPVRNTIRPLTGAVRDLVRFNYEVCIEFQCTDTALADVRGVPRPALDAALFKVGSRRLLGNPAGYLDLAAAEYRGMWSLHTRKHPSIAPRYNAFLRANMPLPFQSDLGLEGRIVPASDQKSYYRYDRLVMFGIAFAIPLMIALLLLLGLARGDRRPLVIVPLSALVGVEAILCFIALVGVGIPRYPLGLWPGIVIGLGLSLIFVLDRIGWLPSALAHDRKARPVDPATN